MKYRFLLMEDSRPRRSTVGSFGVLDAFFLCAFGVIGARSTSLPIGHPRRRLNTLMNGLEYPVQPCTKLLGPEAAGSASKGSKPKADVKSDGKGGGGGSQKGSKGGGGGGGQGGEGHGGQGGRNGESDHRCSIICQV